MKEMSEEMRKVLATAADRPRGNICPTGHAMPYAAAQINLISAMVRCGYADYNDGIPRITDAGRAAVTAIL